MNSNPRLTKKDLALIKGALRRAFARSDLHRKVLDSANVQHEDKSRPKVKGWRRCPQCKKIDAQSYFVVDHILPVVKPGKHYWDYSVQEMADLIWSEETNLQPLCKIPCHEAKTESERLEREALKPRKVKNKNVR